MIKKYTFKDIAGAEAVIQCSSYSATAYIKFDGIIIEGVKCFKNFKNAKKWVDEFHQRTANVEPLVWEEVKA